MNCDNLEVFVLTYNRASVLKTQLISLCNQSAQGFKIRILNNSSTDNTIEVVKEIIKKYPNRDIELITHSENIGNPNNFKMAQKLASRKYCAVFHDDDVVHPEYIEIAMTCFNKNPDAVMASCLVEALYNPNEYNWKKYGTDYYLIEGNDFPFLMFQGDRPSFAASIYKTEAYKSVVYRDDICGKIHDLAFTFELASLGQTIFLGGAFLRYRLSPDQDSNNFKTGPFPEQIANALQVASNKIVNFKFLSKYRLYEFSKLLFSLQMVDKYYNCSFAQFEELLLIKNVFSKSELFKIKMYYKLLKKICKKVVKRKFKKIKRK